MNADDIALCIEIQGVYDGTAVYVFKDGTLVNRFRNNPAYWGSAMIRAADEWIEDNGPQIIAENADLLTKGTE